MFLEPGDAVSAIVTGVITAAKQTALITETTAAVLSGAMTVAGIVLFPSELADEDDLLREYITDIEIQEMKRQIEQIQRQLEPMLDKFQIDYDWEVPGPC